MPAFQEKLLEQLNWKHQLIEDTFTLDIPPGHQIGKPKILFKLLDEAILPKFKEQFGGQNIVKEDVFPLDLRGAVILHVDDHPKDNQLYLVKLDLGDQQRQVVARLSRYSKKELEGKQVVVLCNLAPAIIKESKSEAMILVAEGKKKNDKQAQSEILQPDKVPTKWAGVSILPDGLLKSENNITLKEFQKMDLKLNNKEE